MPASPRRLLILATLALMQACSQGLQGVDERIDRLLAERSRAMNAIDPPRREHRPAAELESPDQYDTQPATANPTPGELEFTPADPNRDSSAKLRAFAREEAGVDKDIEPLVLTLNDAFHIAQTSGREYLTAEEDYILAAVRLLIEQHRWGPRLFNDTSLTFSGSGDDGDIQSALRVVNDLRVSQRLPYGGSVEARWVFTATEQLRTTASGRYAQSSQIILSGNAPLLQGGGQTARESLIQTQRDLIYQARTFERFRRQFLVDVARDYFSLLESKAEIANQKETIRILSARLARDIAWKVAEKLALFDVNNTRNDLLAAISALDDLVDRYATQLDRFKIRLGLDVDAPIRITNTAIDLTEPEITLDEAARRGFDFRLDLQNTRDRVIDSGRQVAIARNTILPEFNLTGSVTVPTDPDVREGGLVFDPDDLNFSAGVTFGLPLDREIERLQLRQAIILVERARRDLDRTEDDVYVAVRAAVRAIERARSDLLLAEQRVRITLRRLEQQRIQEVTTQELLDTAQALLRARNARDRAETRVRTSILDYLLVTGQMRVDRDGLLEPLPGLDIKPIKIFSDTPDIDDWYVSPIDEQTRERIKADLFAQEPPAEEPPPSDPPDDGGS